MWRMVILIGRPQIDFLRRPKVTFYRSKFYFTYPHQAGYYDPPITREKHENGI